MSSAITRKFLGLERPALHLAADYLFERFAAADTCDMGHVIVVVPGRRVQRRLLELLVERAEQHKGRFRPPQVETPGRLPEQFYTPQKPFADELVQRLAWVRVLREANDKNQLGAIAPAPPDPDDHQRWLELADLLRRLHTELAADGLDFADVAQRGASLRGFNEQARWRALAELQTSYLNRLLELDLWDVQTARLVAIEKDECRCERPIVLAGTVDMNLTLRRMLDQVVGKSAGTATAAGTDPVAALVFAPEAWHDRFDEHGCLLPNTWRDVTLDVPEDQVFVVDRPTDQAAEVARQIASFQGRYRADEITVGLPAEQLVPDVARILGQVGVAARWGPGHGVLQTGPCLLLSSIAAVVRGQRFADYATLLRHPDLGDWLTREGVDGDWLTELDEFYQQFLPARLGGAWREHESQYPQLQRAFESLRRLLEPLVPATSARQPQTLAQWSQPLLDLLRNVYGHRSVSPSRPADRGALQACRKLLDVLASYGRVPPELMLSFPASDAIHITLQQSASESVPPAEDPAAVELLGWLELPWDDAPALIVTSMNEGVVPDAVNADIFLPNALRAELGLFDNDRRYARDAYSLGVLLATRQDVRLIVGRRTADGDPLMPSRLLFATEGVAVARRVRKFLRSERATQSLEVPDAWRSERKHANFPMPMPESPRKPITHLSVTDFRAYLACPYRFYLSRVCRLEPVSDEGEELDGAAFGTLLHEVLQGFGGGEERDSTSAERIREVLDHELDRCVAQRFARDIRMAVAVQVEQLRLRLHAFSERQAAWASGGWRIEYTEVPKPGTATGSLTVDGEPIELRGRIDRIDVHAESGQRVILDYKSSDAGQAPDKTHRRKDQWVDLQLPLYRHLAQGLQLAGSPRLGYVTLPRDAAGCGFLMAEWSEAELQEADEVAREVVRAIRAERFWPPTVPPPAFSEALAPICQDGVFDNWLSRQLAGSGSERVEP
jgi:ATP-dependent helicase/nuclease subunit B